MLRKRPFEAKKVPVTKGKVAGFLNFGNDNLLPQTLLDVIDDSETASAAMSIRAEFIEGNGLFDTDLSNMVVNRKGQRLDDIHAANAWNISNGEVVCMHFTYNMLGQKTGVQVIPWEQIRFPEPDDLGNITYAGIFPYLGSSLYPKKAREFKKVYAYNPDPEVVISQIIAEGGIRNYFGQLLYLPAGRSNGDIYHIPYYYGGSKVFETEKELTTHDYRTVTSDFAGAGIIKGLARKKSEQDEEEDGDSMTNRITEHQGAENAGNFMVFEFDNIEELEALEFIPFTGTDLANRYNALSDRVAQLIARRTRVPNELINIRKSGGIAPTGEEIKVASRLMQQTVNRYQRTLTRVYTQVFEHWHKPITGRDFAIENLNYFPNETNGTVAQPK